VYLEPESLEARGRMVLDDGVSVERNVTEVEFSFEDSTLSIKVIEGSNYHSSKVITQVRIFGLHQLPRKVECISTVRCSTIPNKRKYKQGISDFWEPATHSLMIIGVNFEIDPTKNTNEKIFKLVNYRYQLG